MPRWSIERPSLTHLTSGWFSGLANLASVIGIAVTLLVIIEGAHVWILAGYLCLVSLLLLLRVLTQERRASYGEALTVLEQGLRRLKEVSDRRLFRQCSDDDYIESLGAALADLARAFTLVTGTSCRATLKEIYQEEVVTGGRNGTSTRSSELVAASMARSDPALNRRARNEPGDRVADNTDFDEVITTSSPFFCNDLKSACEDGSYRNSHWPDSLRKTGRLPYRSAIVWPIEADRPGGQPVGESNGPRDRVIGLLCVDSNRAGVFREAWDVPLGALFAHALYPVIRYHVGES